MQAAQGTRQRARDAAQSVLSTRALIYALQHHTAALVLSWDSNGYMGASIGRTAQAWREQGRLHDGVHFGELVSQPTVQRACQGTLSGRSAHLLVVVPVPGPEPKRVVYDTHYFPLPGGGGGLIGWPIDRLLHMLGCEIPPDTLEIAGHAPRNES